MLVISREIVRDLSHSREREQAMAENTMAFVHGEFLSPITGKLDRGQINSSARLRGARGSKDRQKG